MYRKAVTGAIFLFIHCQQGQYLGGKKQVCAGLIFLKELWNVYNFTVG